jgi:aminoglycoside phosphotransferase (APT) family kinase protein
MSPGHAPLIKVLRDAGLVRSPAPALRALSGGVSSEILLVDDDGRKFVVKRALAKLRVRDDWFADTSRSRSELAFLRRVGALAPGSTPHVLFAPPSTEWFAMEFLDDGFANWKTDLLAGRTDPTPARVAGNLLGRIHRATWQDAAAAQEFATLENFRQLRLDPYLSTAAERVPELAPLLLAEHDRLAHTALALVHGDFSPKNMLLSSRRLVLLDAEVAWFGDPAFDTAFLLTHFYLKALRRAHAPDPTLALAPVFWDAYVSTLGAHGNAVLEERTARLVLALMLARVHGKSPVEYLAPPQQLLVTRFVRQWLPKPPPRLTLLTAAWRETVLA